MKWNRCFAILIIMSMFFLQGCRQVDLNVEGKITAPTIKELPFQGTWKVERYIEIDNTNTSQETENYIGKTAAFDTDIAVLGDESCNSPQYKIKSVSAEEYFLYKYKVNAGKLGIKEESVNVVTVSSNQQPFHEFIEINDTSMLVDENRGFLYMSKISDKAETSKQSVSSNTGVSSKQTTDAKLDPLQKTGVFIGLRASGTDNTLSSYRTLWIALKDKELRPVYEMKQLLVPRKKGFWEIDYLAQKSPDIFKATLYSHAIIDEGAEFIPDYNNLLQEDGIRDIVFVGNDYVGTEYSNIDPVTLKVKEKYQVLPIDNIKSGRGISISNVAGEDGLNALINSSQAFITSLDKSKSEFLEKNPSVDNFTLTRRNGQWIVTGRLNYLSPVDGKTSEYYNVYLMAPQKLINYDILKLPWNYIKEKVPEAVDVFTSPNKALAVVITKNSIEVYAIENDSLSEKPLRSIKLQKDETVIMAEWAGGEYMEKWEEVIRTRASEIKDNTKK